MTCKPKTKRARKIRLRNKMRRIAKSRQCPECRRKYALKTSVDKDNYIFTACRWCPYFTGRFGCVMVPATEALKIDRVHDERS